MREYVTIVRAILRGEAPPPGEKWRTGFQLGGAGAAARTSPIYIAALSPGMLRLAGEIADGVILWLCNPDYIRDVVVPEVTTGRERAGKTLEGFDVVAAVPAAADRRSRVGVRRDAPRPPPLLRAALLPRDDRAVGLRGRHRRLRRRGRRRREDAGGDLDRLPRRCSPPSATRLRSAPDSSATRTPARRRRASARSRARTSRRRCGRPRRAADHCRRWARPGVGERLVVINSPRVVRVGSARGWR